MSSDKSRLKEGSFDEVLLVSVNEGLSILGESGKCAIYSYLEMSRHVRCDEICEKIDLLDEVLQDLLGAGAMILRRTIAKELYGRLGLNYEPRENWTLAEYVNDAMKSKKEGLKVGQE